MKLLRHLFAAALMLGLATAPAPADQGSLCMPTVGTVSGLTLVTDVNAALQALVTSNNGATAPTNPCATAPQKGQLWLDTSGTPNIWKLYDGTNWLPVGVSDGTNHIWTPPVGGGLNSVASATTTNLWTNPQSYITVSGTTTITGFGAASGVSGTVKFVSFSGVLSLTYNATSLILPTAANITTQAGDKALVVNLGGGNAAVIAYTRADGTSLAANSAFSAAVAFTGIISPTSISGTTNNWAPTGLATASVVRATAASNAIVTGLTAQASGTILILQNISSTTTITLSDASGSSSSANQFAFGADYVLGPRASLLLRYDGTLSKWVGVAGYRLASTGAQALAGTDTTTAMTPASTLTAIHGTATTDKRYVGQQVFTATGTYTPTTGVTYAEAEGVAAGGGGGAGRTDGFNGDQMDAVGGGGGGAFGMAVVSSPTTTTVTCGAAGTGAPNISSNGTDGGDASFGSLLMLGGGKGALSVDLTGQPSFYTGRGAAGGTPTAGTVTSGGYPGESGTTGDGASSSLNTTGGGNGGGSPYGGGGRGGWVLGTGFSAGGAGTGKGTGGGGGAVGNISATQGAGGNGAGCLFIVKEYE